MLKNPKCVEVAHSALSAVKYMHHGFIKKQMLHTQPDYYTTSALQALECCGRVMGQILMNFLKSNPFTHVS